MSSRGSSSAGNTEQHYVPLPQGCPSFSSTSLARYKIPYYLYNKEQDKRYDTGSRLLHCQIKHPLQPGTSIPTLLQDTLRPAVHMAVSRPSPPASITLTPNLKPRPTGTNVPRFVEGRQACIAVNHSRTPKSLPPRSAVFVRRGSAFFSDLSTNVASAAHSLAEI